MTGCMQERDLVRASQRDSSVHLQKIYFNGRTLPSLAWISVLLKGPPACMQERTLVPVPRAR